MNKINYNQTATAEKGRNGDEYTAHVQPGETIVPPVISDELMARIHEEMIAAGIDPNKYTVGEGMSINPETGLPEFGFGKFFKRIARIALPAAAAFIPGLGPVAAGALGAAGGAFGGGGLRGALLGGITGGLGSALSSGALANTALGRGLSSIKSGLSGALSDFGNFSGLSDLFTSASGALDGIGSGLNDAYEGSAVQDIFRSGSDALKSAGIDLGGGDGFVGPPAPVGGNQSVYSDNQAGGSSVFNGNLNNSLSSIGSVLLGKRSNDEAEDALLRGQRANQALLAPFADGFEFSPGDLTQDPGYQFNLQQGNQALDRAQLARGGFFSGNALKEAQTFGQGLADNTYNAAYNRALQARQASLTGALANTGVNTDIGNIRANSATNTGNLFSGALGSFLGGNSFDNTGALQGGRGNDLLTQLLRQQQLQQYGAY